VEDCFELSVFQMREAGVFDSGGGCQWSSSCGSGQNERSVGYIIHPGMTGITLQYIRLDPLTQEEHKYSYDVILTTTPCHFGGIRYWFRCPLLKPDGTPCNRRVAKLYLPPFQSHFGCRHCHDLTYTSRQMRMTGWMKRMWKLAGRMN